MAYLNHAGAIVTNKRLNVFHVSHFYAFKLTEFYGGENYGVKMACVYV